MRFLRSFDSFQQRHHSLAIPVAVIKKFADDQAGSLASLVAYYGFFSLFPLLLVMTTILGYVLQGNAGAQHSVEHSVLGQFPVIGNEIKVHALAGSAAALAIGLITSLLAGLGVTQAAQNAFYRVWAVPMKDRPNFLKTRLRGLLLLIALGVVFVVAASVSGLVTGLGGPVVKMAGIALSLGVNFVLFIGAFRFLTSPTIPTRCLWRGAVIAAIFWEILQVVGGLYVNHVYRHASDTYSQFALVIALLVWLHLGAQLTLYSAEINTVIARRLYPRTLFGPPEVPADEATLRALAKVEERHDEEHIEVEFDQPEPQPEQAPEPTAASERKEGPGPPPSSDDAEEPVAQPPGFF
jgi:membrane protein